MPVNLTEEHSLPIFVLILRFCPAQVNHLAVSLLVHLYRVVLCLDPLEETLSVFRCIGHRIRFDVEILSR
jgi:hypothetical protein